MELLKPIDKTNIENFEVDSCWEINRSSKEFIKVRNTLFKKCQAIFFKKNPKPNTVANIVVFVMSLLVFLVHSSIADRVLLWIVAYTILSILLGIYNSIIMPRTPKEDEKVEIDKMVLEDDELYKHLSYLNIGNVLGNAFSLRHNEVTNKMKPIEHGKVYALIKDKSIELSIFNQPSLSICKREISIEDIVKFEVTKTDMESGEKLETLKEHFHNLEQLRNTQEIQSSIKQATTHGISMVIDNPDFDTIKTHNKQVETNKKIKEEYDRLENINNVLVIKLKDNSNIFVNYLEKPVLEDIEHMIENQ